MIHPVKPILVKAVITKRKTTAKPKVAPQKNEVVQQVQAPVAQVDQPEVAQTNDVEQTKQVKKVVGKK